jgi:hypothetical protein
MFTRQTMYILATVLSILVGRSGYAFTHCQALWQFV